jgi:hypothetical protein
MSNEKLIGKNNTEVIEAYLKGTHVEGINRRHTLDFFIDNIYSLDRLVSHIHSVTDKVLLVDLEQDEPVINLHRKAVMLVAKRLGWNAIRVPECRKISEENAIIMRNTINKLRHKAIITGDKSLYPLAMEREQEFLFYCKYFDISL